MVLAYGIGGLVKVPPGALSGNGAPPASLKGTALAQNYVDLSAQSQDTGIYFWDGNSWVQNNLTLSTDDTFASASNSTASSSLAIKTYVDNTAIAGAPIADNATFGIVELSTDARAVAGTANTPGVTAYVLQPENLAPVFAAPPAIGGTTPAAGTFTTLDASGLITGTASALIDTGGTALNLATDASADAVNIGTGAAARTITVGNSTGATSLVFNCGTGALNIGTNAIAHTVTIGNVTGATAVNINAGTGGVALASTGSGDITINSDDTLLLDADGVLELNSSAGAISVGNDADNQAINVGTGGVRTITIGSTTAGTALAFNNGASYTLDGITTSTYAIGASTTTGTILIGGTAQTGTITLGSSSGTNTVAIGAGAGDTTVSVAGGTAGANTVNILNGATAANSAVNIYSGIGTAGAGTVKIGNNTRMTTLDLANIAPAAARTITVAGGNSAQNDTVSVLGGNPTANTQKFEVLSGAPSGGTQTVNIFNGNATGGTLTYNLFGATAATTAGNINIGTGAAAHVLTVGNAASGAQTWNVGSGNLAFVGGANSIGIGDDAAANTVTVGSTTGAAATTVQSGTGNLALTSTDALTLDAVGVLELNSSAGVIGIGNDAVAQNINIGTGAAARTITLGNVTGATAVAVNAGTGGIALASTGTGDITINSDDTLLLDSDGVLELNSSAGAISIANDAVALTVNVATGAAAMTLNLGSTTTTSATNIDAGTGSIVFGSGHVVPITSATNAANPNNVDGGDYFIACNTAAAVTVTLPAAPADGQTYIVADSAGTASANNITIAGNGKNINGAGSLTVSTDYQVTTLWYNGTFWNYLQ